MPLTPETSNLARPSSLAWVACACTAAGLALERDAPWPPTRPVVLWVGTSDAARDEAYRRFAQALAGQPTHRRDVELRYQTVRDQGPAAAQEDLQRQATVPPAVWVAPTADAARAVHRSHPGQKLVFATYPDPVRMGLVASLHRPAGRATGVLLNVPIDAKRLELLRDAFPQARVVGVLLDRSWAETREIQPTLLEPAQALGLRLRLHYAEDATQVDTLFQSAAIKGVEAWYIPATYIAYRAEAAILRHLARLQQPAIHASIGEVERGALMAYAQDTSFAYAMLAELATRVATGEDPGAIPVQRPLRFVLAVRPRAEPAALRIDAAVIRRADRIH